MTNNDIMKYAVDLYGFLAPINGEMSGEDFAAAIRKAYAPSVKTAIVCDCVSRFLFSIARRGSRTICEYRNIKGLDANNYEK